MHLSYINALRSFKLRDSNKDFIINVPDADNSELLRSLQSDDRLLEMIMPLVLLRILYDRGENSYIIRM